MVTETVLKYSETMKNKGYLSKSFFFLIKYSTDYTYIYADYIKQNKNHTTLLINSMKSIRCALETVPQLCCTYQEPRRRL